MTLRLKHSAGRLMIILIAMLACVGAERASAVTAVRFTLDRPIDGAAAPFVVATDKGLFAAEALNVTIDSATGSKDVIGRVANGTSDIGKRLAGWRSRVAFGTGMRGLRLRAP